MRVKLNQALDMRAVVMLLITTIHFGFLTLLAASASQALQMPPLPQPMVMVEMLPTPEPEPVVQQAPQPKPPEAKPEPRPEPKKRPPKPQPKRETPRTTTSEKALTAPPPEPQAPAPVAAAEPTAPPAPPAPSAPPAPPAPLAPVTPPRINASYLNNPKPVYPPMLRRAGEEGRVVLEVFVTADGNAGEVRVLQRSSSPLFDEAALTAVRKWRFVPARRGDTPVAEWYRLPIDFKLN